MPTVPIQTGIEQRLPMAVVPVNPSTGDMFESIFEKIVNLHSGASATGNGTVADLQGYLTRTVVVTGTASLAAVIEGSSDNASGGWLPVPYRVPSSDTSTIASFNTTPNVAHFFYLDPKYVRYIRLRSTALGGGLLTADVFALR